MPLTYGVADAIIRDIKAWYTERIDDQNVAKTWKHLHSVLFKKVRVPCADDIWCRSGHPPSGRDPAEGVSMVVSEEFVALQVKK